MRDRASPTAEISSPRYDCFGNRIETTTFTGVTGRGERTTVMRFGADGAALRCQVERLVRDGERRVVERWFPFSQCDFAAAPAGRRVEKIEYDANARRSACGTPRTARWR